MLKRISFVVLVLALALARSDRSVASPVSSISGNRMIVILPARQRILQLGFDLLTLRPRLVLMSYQGTAENGDLAMHLWNGERWLPLSEQDYEAGRFLKSGVRVAQVYLIGPEDDVPWVLQYRPLWADDMHWVQSLHGPDIVNVMGERFRFTRQEWQRMAAWHDLRLYETTVRHRHVQREATWRETPPDEARRPILERLGRRRSVPERPMPAPVRIERQPWTEVSTEPSPAYPKPVEQPEPLGIPQPLPPVDEAIELEDPEPIAVTTDDDPAAPAITIIDRAPEEPVDATLPADPVTDDETAPMAPLMEDTPEAPVIEPEPATETPVAPTVMPAKDAGEPERVEDEADSVPAPVGEAPEAFEMEKGVDRVSPVETPPAPAAAQKQEADPVRNERFQDLTPEEIEFFRLIREEFPDLDDLPDLP